MIVVDLPEGQLKVDWNRLAVWQDFSTDFSWPKYEDFLNAVRSEIKFQATKQRMIDWMAGKGNQIRRSAFEQEWAALGHR
jgi:hypothetical protein